MKKDQFYSKEELLAIMKLHYFAYRAHFSVPPTHFILFNINDYYIISNQDDLLVGHIDETLLEIEELNEKVFVIVVFKKLPKTLDIKPERFFCCCGNEENREILGIEIKDNTTFLRKAYFKSNY